MSPEIVSLEAYLSEKAIKVKLLHTQEVSTDHIFHFYWINPNTTTPCHKCSNRAVFLCYDKAHDGTKSADAFCNDHATNTIRGYLDAAESL